MMPPSRQQLRAQARADAFKEVTAQYGPEPRRARRRIARRLVHAWWRRGARTGERFLARVGGLGIAAAIVGLILGAAGAPQARGQGTRKDDMVLNARGFPAGGASVAVCAQPAVTTTTPCSPLANIYSNPQLTQALVNPLATDGLGNYNFYAAPGKYTIQIYGPGIATRVIPDATLPSDPSAPTFTTVTTTSGITAFSLTLSGNLTVSGSANVTLGLSAATMTLTNQGSPPATPSAGTTIVYSKTDKKLYQKDDTGAETQIGAGSGGAGNLCFASKQSGATADLQIQACINSLPSTGGTVYADPQGAQTIATDVFSAVTKNVHLIFTSGQYTPSLNTTIPGNISVEMKQGAQWSIPNGVLVTIKGAFTAPKTQVFNLTGTGNVSFDSIGNARWGAFRTPEVDILWWGAVCDGSADDTPAINAALAALGNHGGTLVMNGQPQTNGVLVWPTALSDWLIVKGSGLWSTQQPISPPRLVAFVGQSGGDDNFSWLGTYWRWKAVAGFPANAPLYQPAAVPQGGSYHLENVSLNNSLGGPVIRIWNTSNFYAKDVLVNNGSTGNGAHGIEIDRSFWVFFSNWGSTIQNVSQVATTAAGSVHITVGSQVVTISSASRSGGTATITTAWQHNFSVGQSVTIAGVSDAAFNIATTVATIPTLTTFTYALAGSGSGTGGTATGAGTQDSGLIKFDNGEIATQGFLFDATQTPTNQVGNTEVHFVTYESGNTSLVRANRTNTPISQITLDHVEIADAINVPATVEVVGTGLQPVSSICVRHVTGNTAPGGQIIKGANVQNSCPFEGAGAPLSGGEGVNYGDKEFDQISWLNGFNGRVLNRGSAMYPGLQLPGALAVQQDVTQWSSLSGTATVTTGILAPDTSATAAKLTSASGVLNRLVFNASVTWGIGDWAVIGGWTRSEDTTKSPYGQAFLLTLGGGATLDDGRNVSVGTLNSQVAEIQQYGAYVSWMPFVRCAKINGAGTGTNSLALQVDSTHPTSFWKPFFLRIASGTMTDGEVVRFCRAMLPNQNVNAPANSIATFDNETLYAGKFQAAGDTAFSASPRSEYSAFLPGALTSTWTGATLTLDKAVTVTRVQAQVKTAPSGCGTNAIARLSDGTTNQDVTISAAANDSGAIAKNYTAGAALTIAVQTAAAGCTTNPADANVIVQYRMQ